MKENILRKLIREEIRSVLLIHEVSKDFDKVLKIYKDIERKIAKSRYDMYNEKEPAKKRAASDKVKTLDKEKQKIKKRLIKTLKEAAYSQKVKVKKMPSGWDKGPYGSPKSYADFGGSGFKKGKDWTLGPRGPESKIGSGIPEEEKQDEKETGYKPE